MKKIDVIKERYRKARERMHEAVRDSQRDGETKATVYRQIAAYEKAKEIESIGILLFGLKYEDFDEIAISERQKHFEICRRERLGREE